MPTAQLILNAFLTTPATTRPRGGTRLAAERVFDIDFYVEQAQRRRGRQAGRRLLRRHPRVCGRRRAHRPTAHLEPITPAGGHRRRAPSGSASSRPRRRRSTSPTTWPGSSPRSTSSPAAAPAGTSSPRSPNAGRAQLRPRQLPSAEERYARAQEFVDVVTKLWDSWEDDAVLTDREQRPSSSTRTRCTRSTTTAATSRSRGRSRRRRSPQGRPVLVQAGSSNQGRAFAAPQRRGDLHRPPDDRDAQAFYTDIKARRRTAGRDPDHVKILPGISPVHRRHRGGGARSSSDDSTTLAVLDDRAGAARRASGSPWTPRPRRGGADDLRRRGPRPGQQPQPPQVVADIVERDRPAAQLLHRLGGARGHRVVAGTPEQVADTITEWFANGAADGFNVMPPCYPRRSRPSSTTSCRSSRSAGSSARVRRHDAARPLRTARPGERPAPPRLASTG